MFQELTETTFSHFSFLSLSLSLSLSVSICSSGSLALHLSFSFLVLLSLSPFCQGRSPGLSEGSMGSGRNRQHQCEKGRWQKITFLKKISEIWDNSKGCMLVLQSTEMMRDCHIPLFPGDCRKPIFVIYHTLNFYMLKGRFPLYVIHFSSRILD